MTAIKAENVRLKKDLEGYQELKVNVKHAQNTETMLKAEVERLGKEITRLNGALALKDRGDLLITQHTLK